jgi:hypothetical protein
MELGEAERPLRSAALRIARPSRGAEAHGFLQGVPSKLVAQPRVNSKYRRNIHRCFPCASQTPFLGFNLVLSV